MLVDSAPTASERCVEVGRRATCALRKLCYNAETGCAVPEESILKRAVGRCAEAGISPISEDANGFFYVTIVNLGFLFGCGPYFLVKSALRFRARPGFGVSEGCQRGIRGAAWIGSGPVSEDPRTAGTALPEREQKRAT